MGEYVQNYTIKTPIIKQPIKIRTVNRNLTPTIPMTEDNLNNQKWGTEYQIGIENLYEATFIDVIVYQCRRFTDPAYEEFMRNGGREKLLKMEQRRTQNLIKLADQVSPYVPRK